MKFKNKICVGLAIIALCAGCSQSDKTAPSSASPDPKQVEVWKNENHAGVDALSASNWAGAVQHLEAAKDTARQFGAKDVRLAGTLLNLAAAYEGQNKLDEAAAAASEAVTIFRQSPGADKPTITSLVMLAKVTNRQGKPADAAKFYEEAVAIMDKIGNGSSADAQIVLKEYAATLQNSGRADDAKLVQSRVDKLNH